MKNKKTLIVLVPLVLLIWGLILWKVLDYQSADGGAGQNMYTSGEDPIADTTSYDLRFGYRDPFLRSYSGSRSSESSKSKVRANNIKQVEIAKVANVVRPASLVYRGEIKGHRCKLGLLEVEGKKMLVSEHSTVGEYIILSVYSDSLTLSYRDKQFTYGKQ